MAILLENNISNLSLAIIDFKGLAEILPCSSTELKTHLLPPSKSSIVTSAQAVAGL